MKKQPYHFEIKDLITQFVAAFNDVVINRYNKSRSIVDKINVRYVYSPKQRVLHDLVNKSQHLTLPVVAISITSVARASDRVFNKIVGTYDRFNNPTDVRTHLPAPVPVDIGVNMSIMTKFQTDMDQILSNFIPYSNPYIILSWKVPSQLISDTREIRSEVLWDGSVNLTYPTEQEAGATARVTADTTFTIKGWLFPFKSETDVKNIFYINTNLTPVTGFGYI